MNETFPYPLRHRLTSLPSFVFLLGLFTLMLLAPEQLWGRAPDMATHRAALAVIGAMAVVTGLTALRRLTEPFEIRLGSDALHGRRLVGGPQAIRYESIEKIIEHPVTFLRPSLELEVRGVDSRVVVSSRIQGYERLRELLVKRANPLADVRLVNVGGTAP